MRSELGIPFKVFVLILAIILVGHLVGCRTIKVSALGNGQPSLNAKLKGLVYEDLVAGKSSALGRSYYGVFCLDDKRENSRYFNELFQGHAPPVECGTNRIIFYSDRAVDRMTKKPGVIFKADVISISNNAANVVGTWYSGPMAAETIRYRLTPSGTNWVIADKFVISTS